MIISNLNGGLGNQMFQYALGFKMSKVLNTELKLDITTLSTDSLRQFALKPFGISNQVLDKQPEEMPLVTRFLKGVPKDWKVVREQKEFQFDEQILQSKGNIKLYGYWQSPNYFNDIRPMLLNVFSVEQPSEEFKAKQKQLTDCNSVSIHVRRGDYVNVESTNKIHGTCNMDYYQRAMQLVREKAGDNVQFFVFSDDIEWCRNEFKQYENTTVMESISDCEDMLLMSSCKHNIIANSSYSWWGAWLNKNENKIVIAPKKWMNDTSKNTDEIVPDGWYRI